MDLLDLNDPVTDIYTQMGENLKPLLDGSVYPVNDADLFNDFVERFCDRYINRFISFDTYGLFYMKLKFVLEQNKAKYKRIYELALKDIDPLLTYRDKETVKEDTTIKAEGESTTNNATDSTNSHTGTVTNDTTAGQHGFTEVSFDNRKDSTTYKPKGKEITTNKTVSAGTSNPKSYASVPTKLENLKYIDNEQIGENTATTTYENKEDTTDTTKTGKEKNTVELDNPSFTLTTYGDTIANNGTSKTSVEDKNDNIKDSLITRIREGFNGDPMELLAKYEKLVFDLNGEIIEDINRARLFMSVLC